jgi:predicted dehydrogenase
VPASIRIGLAGYGLGGRYFHAPLLACAPDCEFVGVVTTSPERRRQVAADLARPAFSLQELASAGADAVAISTPAATHVTLTQQALHLGPGGRLPQAVRAGRQRSPFRARPDHDTL